jgi:TetR/AcrR family transcriptional repressor of nem operon
MPPDTRERIILAAAEAWHSKSFDGVGVAEVCRLAKVNKGSFFHFFESKHDLLIAVLERLANEVREHLVSGPFSPEVPPLERLDRFLGELGSEMKEECRGTGAPKGCPFGNIISELATRDPAARDAAARALDVMRSLFADTLREAVADGSLPPDVDAEVGADAITAYLQGLAVFSKAYGDPARVEKIGVLLPLLVQGARSGPRTSQGRKAGTRVRAAKPG